MSRAEVVVVGAGIAGIATAYDLSVKKGAPGVVVVDPRPPLSLTSDKSTECYRNWWPSAPMVGLMNRSIDLLEEMSEVSGNAFGLNRRGYLFVTADPGRLEELTHLGMLAQGFGAGAVRTLPGDGVYGNEVDGVDVLDPDTLTAHFPYLTEEAVGALHVRRAGWFSAQQLGAWMLDRARESGAELIRAGVTSLIMDGDTVTGVVLADGSVVDGGAVVDAAGPMSREVASWAGIDLPLIAELHLKVGFRDHLGVIPRDAPMLIWSDPQEVAWSDEERSGLLEAQRPDLLGELPVFCHGRPEGGADSPWFLALWEYHREIMEPVWPLPEDPLYPEVVMRGLVRMIPGLRTYLDRLPESHVDGGYYVKTPENRPLIGPCGPEGFHAVAGLSGFGVMVAAGAADLAARHIVGEELPSYAEDFLLSRYDDPSYEREVVSIGETGQL